MAWVRLKDGVTHRSGQAKGGETIRVTANELRDFGDKFILGVESPGKEGTDAAVELHAENRSSLPPFEDIEGSGEKGIVLKGDVEALLEMPEEEQWWW